MISSFHPLDGRYPRGTLTPQFTPLDRRVSLFPFPGVRAQELIADKRTPKKKKEAQDKRSTCVIHAEAAASIFDQLQLNEDYSPYRSQMGAKVSDRGSYWAHGLKLFLHLRAAKPTIILHQEVSL